MATVTTEQHIQNIVDVLEANNGSLPHNDLVTTLENDGNGASAGKLFQAMQANAIRTRMVAVPNGAPVLNWEVV